MEDLMIKNCTQKPAKGMKGIILYTVNNQYVFRVYKEDNSFTDYGIHHCDLDVTIDSDDAVLYEYEDGRNILDHSYEVLGINHLTDKGYEVGTEEGLNEFIQSRNKI
jgi:hypothetical protein